MDTILDFSLSKTHGVAPPPQTSPNTAVPFPSNLNLGNLNLNSLTALSSLLMKSVAALPLVAATAPAQQQLHHSAYRPHSDLIKELSAVVGNNFSGSIPSALTNLNIPISTASAYSSFAQSNEQQQQQQQNQQQAAAALAATVLAAQTLAISTPPPSVDSTTSAAISPFDIGKNALVKALTDAVDARNEVNMEYETTATTKLVKPLAKRFKFSDSATNFTLNEASAAIINQPKVSSLITTPTSTGLCASDSLPISAATSLINLHLGAAAAAASTANSNKNTALLLPCSSPPMPPTPTRSSSIASSSVSSTQNSPISASLRRNSLSVSTIASNNSKSATTTPQRRPAAPIPENLKDEAYYERRKKNNDAAKRSRDSRRQKEEQTARRATFLEQENIELCNEIDHLKAEINRLHSLIHANSKNFLNTTANIEAIAADNLLNHLDCVEIEDLPKISSIIAQKLNADTETLEDINGVEDSAQQYSNGSNIKQNGGRHSMSQNCLFPSPKTKTVVVENCDNNNNNNSNEITSIKQEEVEKTNTANENFENKPLIKLDLSMYDDEKNLSEFMQKDNANANALT